MDPYGAVIRLSGNVSPQLQAGLAWRRYRRTDATLKVIDAVVRRDETAVDIGASVGLFTARLSWLVGRHGRVHAFEPNPTHRARLEAIARRRNVIVHLTALSNHNGTADFSIPLIAGSAAPGLGTLVVDAAARAELRNETISVHVERLDDVLGDTPVSFVKCDVEGHQLAVLQGAARILARTHPTLVVEIEQRHQTEDVQLTFDYLASYEYAGYMIRATSVSPIEAFDLERDQLAYLGPTFTEFMPADYVANFVFIRPALAGALDSLLAEDEG